MLATVCERCDGSAKSAMLTVLNQLINNAVKNRASLGQINVVQTQKRHAIGFLVRDHKLLKSLRMHKGFESLCCFIDFDSCNYFPGKCSAGDNAAFVFIKIEGRVGL